MAHNAWHSVVGLIGGPGNIEESYSKTTKELHQLTGNTGNLAFRYAMSRHIALPKVPTFWSSNPEVVRKSCDVLVFPAATQLSPRHDMQMHAEFVEKVDLPVVVIGLGQASIWTPDARLQQGTVRWLKAISERAYCIGVRGEYTADLLGKIGIKNTAVTGCPSNFISPICDLGVLIEKKMGLEKSRVAITDSAVKGGLKSVEQKLIALLESHCGAYICQSRIELLSLSRNRWEEVSQQWLKALHLYLMPDKPYGDVLLFIKKYFRVFFDVDAWMEFLSAVDFSVGTRMHGNILAIQSATPAVCIYHDRRTEELCNTMKVPHVSVDTFLRSRNIDDLIELADFSGREFDTKRLELALVYRDILTKSGVKVSESLNSLVEQMRPVAI